jgi:hypothetical protein
MSSEGRDREIEALADSEKSSGGCQGRPVTTGPVPGRRRQRIPSRDTATSRSRAVFGAGPWRHGLKVCLPEVTLWASSSVG